MPTKSTENNAIKTWHLQETPKPILEPKLKIIHPQSPLWDLRRLDLHRALRKSLSPP